MTVWRNRRFRLFWTGDTISAIGGALSTVAIPLLATVTLHAGGVEIGTMRAAQTLPFLLFAVPIGVLADRISRRRLLLAADAMRFPLVALIALAGAALGLPALIGLVFMVGIGTVAYEVAYLSVLPELVDGPAELPAANRAVETAHAGAGLLGWAAGAGLVAVLTPAAVVGFDAVSFGAGAALTAVNRWPPPEPSTRATRRGGWTWAWRDRFVRPMTCYLAVNNVAEQAFQTALLLFVVHTLHGRSAFGFVLAASGAGFLAGAAISPGLARRIGTGWVITGASLVGACGIALIGVAPGLPLVLAGAVLAGGGPGMLNLHSIAVRQALTPPALLGRVNTVVKMVSYGAATVGAFLGGLAAPRTVILAAAGVSALATVFPAGSAVRRLGRVPSPAPAG